MAAFYNEIDDYAADWLRNLIREGLIPDGEVCTTSIVDLRPADLAGFDQCHFFAGLGGWGHALRLAGWPDDRPIWTGSCPCQPFSVAGKGAGVDDPRHLWPHFFRLIRACRPVVVMGEQVAGQAGYGWLDGVVADLAGEGYACRGVDIPACAVDAPHIRSRLYWVAVADAARERKLAGADERAGDGRGGVVVAGSEPRRDGVDGGDSSFDLADAFGGERGRRADEPVGRPAGREAAGGLGAGTGHGDLADAAASGKGRRGVCGPGEGRGANQERASGQPAGPRPSDGERSPVADADQLGSGEEREQRGGKLGGAGGGQGARAGCGAELGSDHCGCGWPYSPCDVADRDDLGCEDERLAGLRRAAVHDADGRGQRVDLGNPDGARGEAWLPALARRGEGHAEELDDGGRGQLGVGQERRNGTHWSDHVWLNGADGKARRAFTDIRVLVDGLPSYLGQIGPEGFAEAVAEVVAHGQAFEGGAAEALRAVWLRVHQEPEAFRSVGERAGIPAAEILLPYLRQLASACDEAGHPVQGSQVADADVRGVWSEGAAARASCERGSVRQQPFEHPNALHSLSWVLAQHAGAAWDAHRRQNAQAIPLLTRGEPARVGRLRAYGNAIVPALAAEVVAAFMDVEAA